MQIAVWGYTTTTIILYVIYTCPVISRCCGLLALGLLAPVTPRRLRLAKGVQADVVLLVGPGPCPWGEGGTDTMAAALGFTEAATWDVAIRQLAWKLQQAVPGLDVKIAKVDEKLEAKLLVVVNVDQESLGISRVQRS